MVLITVVILSTACGFQSMLPSSPPPAEPSPVIVSTPISIPPTPQVATGKGAIVGVVRGRDGGPLPKDTRAFLTTFIWNATKTHGIYALDPARTPSVLVEVSGWFQFVNIEPGTYVVVVGTTPEKAAVIIGDDGQARVIEVKPDQVVDLGEQRVDAQ